MSESIHRYLRGKPLERDYHIADTKFEVPLDGAEFLERVIRVK